MCLGKWWINPALSSGFRIVLVIVFGALSCEPSTVKTGMFWSLRRLKFLIAFSSVVLFGLAWWKRSPAIIRKSGLSCIALSTSSVRALSKSCLLVSNPYCWYPRCRSDAWMKVNDFKMLFPCCFWG